MKLKGLISKAIDKNNFLNVEDYLDYCKHYLQFIKKHLQAVIVSRNENKYRFFQYRSDGTYNVTRPINNELMMSLESVDSSSSRFMDIISHVRNKEYHNNNDRSLLNNLIYTCQQSIGATLDALPANKSNTARKINGDLFERFIRLIISKTGIDVADGTIQVPVKVNDGIAFTMTYQHDLIIKVDDTTKAIGSVKTSSKDRLDKIFVDKYLYNKLTDRSTPHFAIFLNDVQRKGKEGKYGINTTFLPGHFKGYTIKLNPLDGVYYLDIRPNMQTEHLLKEHIRTFDNFLLTDIWKFVE